MARETRLSYSLAFNGNSAFCFEETKFLLNKIGKHAQIIRDYLPHSPAKTGALKDLNKVKIIETIVSTMKPQPLVNAMNKNLGLIIGDIRGNIGRVGIGGIVCC